MPMPRTKVQGLGAHVSSMANSARGYVFGSGDRSSQQSKSLKGGAGLLGDDSSSDSNSSDSDSEISDAEGTQSFLSKINAATASKKAKASESAAKSSATKSAPGDTPRPKTLEPAQKNGTKAIIKSPAVSSSQSKIAAIKKESAKDDSDTTSSDSSSEEDSSSSESSDSDESGDEAKDAGAKLDTESGKKAAPPAKTGDDSSSESDSESEEEVANAKSSKSKATKISTQVSKPTKAVAKEATKEVAPASDSDSESSEDEAEQSLKTKAMAKKGAASAVSNGSAKSKDASSLAKAPNVAAEESFSEDDSDVEVADESFALARTDDVDPDAVEVFVREGFQLRKASENTQANEVLDMFKKAKREGKQIWYFTTPASVPISVIEKMEFPMKNAQTGDSIVSHDGVDYGVDLGASGKPSTFQILVPAKKGASYDIVDRPVDHTMHLKRITQLAATDFTAKPKPQVSHSKPPRPQPADLKRRFTPIGVPTPVLPPLVPNPKKRGGDVAMVDAVIEGKDENQRSSKKSKKRKLADDAVKASKEEKKAKKAKTASEEQATKANAGASLANSQPIKKASPVPVPSPGGRAPSFSQPAPSAAASVSTPVTSKRKKSKSGEKANDTPATDTLSSKVKKSKKTKSDASVRQTPVPIPTIPGLKK
ncbi:hypothetical protein RB597_001319 [Gaeumannomyces tritici]